MSFPLQFKKHISEGGRFQRELAEFIVKMDLKTIVETGYGLSTFFILNAINEYHKPESMRLYSIDPKPWFKESISHAQHTLIKERSIDALIPLFEKTGLWDLFLHDSNHDVKCQAYEFYTAFDCVRPGGFICCDDYTWAGHKAWEEFCNEVNLTPFQMGSLQVVQLPKTHEPKGTINNELNKTKATEKETLWLSKGNKNHEIFVH